MMFVEKTIKETIVKDNSFTIIAFLLGIQVGAK